MSVDLSMTMSLSDADFLARMKNFEDHLVERKTAKDDKDWKRTAVAFANSVPIGLPAVLYIGVTDDGEIQTPQANLDDIQEEIQHSDEESVSKNALCDENHKR
jgi:predicted HTH transcriptional regulator